MHPCMHPFITTIFYCNFSLFLVFLLLSHQNRSCFLTSSLIGTIAMTLQIPLAMLFDVIFKSKTYSSLFYLGTIPMCCSLFFVSFLMKNDDSDPMWRLIKIAYRKFCLCRRPNIVRYENPGIVSCDL